MSRPRGFEVDWYSGASAQLELLPPEKKSRKERYYSLKYTPPFRTTIRPPIEENSLGTDVLKPIASELDQVTTTLAARSAKQSKPSRVFSANDQSLETIKMLGTQLFQQLVPRKYQGDLRRGGLFLEFGLDEELLNYPWELMHDGSEFLCLKHFLGRFVNTSGALVSSQNPSTWSSSGIDNLSVLLISVPEPLRVKAKYEDLPGAEAETRELSATLDALKRNGVEFELLRGSDATYNNVWKALERKPEIIHFIGHATYNDENPFKSGLALYDQDLTSKSVSSYFSVNPPVLCFMNACETGRTGSPGKAKSAQNIYGLAEAFLRAGTYLIGSRWKLGDNAAVAFSKKFYSLLLGEEKSIGEAITEARIECKKKSPEDPFSWASYIFYGDPRLYFRALE